MWSEGAGPCWSRSALAPGVIFGTDEVGSGVSRFAQPTARAAREIGGDSRLPIAGPEVGVRKVVAHGSQHPRPQDLVVHVLDLKLAAVWRQPPHHDGSHHVLPGVRAPV